MTGKHSFSNSNSESMVSIIMPVYRAESTLRETIESIRRQTFTGWTLIIVEEFGDSDDSRRLLQQFANEDPRIRILQNDSRLGLAESLNLGIRNSNSTYIARIDADDLMHPERLETQVQYMEQNPETGITQFYQKHFGSRRRTVVHKPPVDSEDIRAKLLFFCDVCHSTIMIRRSVMVDNDLWYRDVPLEDYDLWLRAAEVTRIETIPLVYGEYRLGGMSSTKETGSAIQEYMGQRIAGNIENIFGISVDENDIPLLNGWTNVFTKLYGQQRKADLNRLRSILLEIWDANSEIRYYEPEALLKSICAKWRWSRYNEPWAGEKKVLTINEALELDRRRLSASAVIESTKVVIKKCLKKSK